MEQATTVSSSHNHEETGMEQVWSDMQALKRLYGLLHTGQADENLDETSRALLMRMLDDATQQALLRQAKMLSGPLMSPVLEKKLSFQSEQRTVKPIASPSRSLQASERSQFKLQSSTRSRDGHGHHHHHHPTAQQRLARIGSNRSSRTATQQPGRRNGQHADRKNRRGQSLERSNRHLLPSGEPAHRRTPLQPQQRRAVSQHAGVEGSTRTVRRLNSGMSTVSKAIERCRPEPVRRSSHGLSRSRPSFSSSAAFTVHSGSRPNQALSERCLRRGDEKPGIRRRDAGMDRSSRLGALYRINSGSTYHSSSATGYSCPSTSRTVSSSYAASRSSASCSDRRHYARLPYPYEASSTTTSSRRQRQEVSDSRGRIKGEMYGRKTPKRREGPLRRLKNKMAVVFHHHHHHHFGRERASSRGSMTPHRRNAPRGKYLGRIFHRTADHNEQQKAAQRKAGSMPAKHRGRGHLHALFDALARHKWDTGRGPTRSRLRQTGNRIQARKLHWWQRLRRQRAGAEAASSSKPHLHLRPGKAAASS